MIIALSLLVVKRVRPFLRMTKRVRGFCMCSIKMEHVGGGFNLASHLQTNAWQLVRMQFNVGRLNLGIEDTVASSKDASFAGDAIASL